MSPFFGKARPLSGILLGSIFLAGTACRNTPSPAPWSLTGEQPRQRLGAKVAPAGDVNGDGYADLAVWSEGFQKSRGMVSVYLGSARGLSRTPAFFQAGEGPADQYGHSFGGVGDVNGDGFGDFLVAAQNHSPPGLRQAGKAYLYLGSPRGPLPRPAWTRTGSTAQELFGDCSGPIGDADGDGLSDVVIGAYGFDQARGAVYVFTGMSSGLSTRPLWSAQGESQGDWFGYSVAASGDHDGSGRTGLVVGAKTAMVEGRGRAGKVYVYCASEGGFSRQPCWSAAGEGPFDHFGWRAVSAGDVNGDGFDDLAVSAYKHDGPAGESSGKVYVYCGSPQGLSREPCWTQNGPHRGAFFGTSIAGGDFNGDSYSDLMVGCPGCPPDGKVFLFAGGPVGLSRNPVWMDEGEGGDFGSYVAAVGDVNGDGFLDAAIGAPAYSRENKEWMGKVYLFYGKENSWPAR